MLDRPAVRSISPTTLQALMFLSAIFYSFSFWMYPTTDPDLGWHLLGGEWMRVHGGVPTKDFVNAFNHSWHDYHWLYQKLIYAIFELGGFDALRLAFGIAMAFVSIQIIGTVLEVTGGEKHFDIVAAAYLVAIASFYHIVSLRPQVVSLSLILYAQWRLMSPRSALEIPALLLVATLAVNTHVYWVFIPVLWGLYRCLPRIMGRRSTSAIYAWGGLAALCSAGLVSPYSLGIGGVESPFLLINYALVWDYLSMPPALSGKIAELRGGLCGNLFGATMLIGSVALFARGSDRKMDGAFSPQLAAAILGCFLVVKSVKFASLGTILALPALVQLAVRLKRELTSRSYGPRTQSGVALVAMLALSTYGLVSAVRYFPPVRREANTAFMRMFLPLEACRHMAGLGLSASRPTVRVLTHFDHGGWCRFALHHELRDGDYRVTTDGRTQWVPPLHFLRSFELYEMRPGWDRTLDAWEPDLALLHREHPLSQGLALLPERWQKTFEDNHYLVFLRQP